MIEVGQTQEFSAWLHRLRDANARRAHRCPHSPHGTRNPGDTRNVGEGILEMRIDHGPGYRLYYLPRRHRVIRLCGGEKRTQRQDIKPAQMLAKNL
jgi:putative addiction module killer protein